MLLGPTYLYVKTHNTTGMKYFGKTCRKDPYSYRGSGAAWRKHLREHGCDLSTEIIGFFEVEDEEECKRVAREFSRAHNISKSPIWANLVAEGVTGGAICSKEQASMGGKIGGRITKDLQIGIHTTDKHKKSEWGKAGGRVGGRSCKINGNGIFSLSEKDTIENLKKARQIQIETKTNKFVFASKEEQSERGKRGGIHNRGTFWYNDGITNMKFKPSHHDISFELFLSQTGFNRGRVKR